MTSDVIAGHRNAVWKGHLPIRVGKLPSGEWVGDCPGYVPGGAGAGGRCGGLALAVGRADASAGRPGKAGRLPCPGRVPGGACAGGRCACLARHAVPPPVPPRPAASARARLAHGA